MVNAQIIYRKRKYNNQNGYFISCLTPYVRLINDRVTSLTLYNKSEQSDISDTDLLNIIKNIE
ncbi:MAG: hypothetical protein U5L45_08200 [Saprospiraceae bacterium]|nr:hypothetical protein [Saprospiraceae bacterium]